MSAGTALKCLLLVVANTEESAQKTRQGRFAFFLSLFLFARPFRKAVKRVQTSVVCRAKINFLLRFHCEILRGRKKEFS